jgi:hypothetical protein
LICCSIASRSFWLIAASLSSFSSRSFRKKITDTFGWPHVGYFHELISRIGFLVFAESSTSGLLIQHNAVALHRPQRVRKLRAISGIKGDRGEISTSFYLLCFADGVLPRQSGARLQEQGDPGVACNDHRVDSFVSSASKHRISGLIGADFPPRHDRR